MALTKKQFNLVRIARGLGTDAILTKTGIPPQSLLTLMQDENGRDPGKLISEATYHRLATLLCLKPDLSGLRTEAVVEWRVNQSDRKNWLAAAEILRRELFGDQIDMVVMIEQQKKLFKKRNSIVLILDQQKDIKLAITNVTENLIGVLQKIFNIEKARQISFSKNDLDFNGKLIENGVFRVNQFLNLIGGRTVKYTWDDVQAAAKEFGLTTDNLIDLIAQQVHSKIAEASSIEPLQSFDRDFRVAA